MGTAMSDSPARRLKLARERHGAYKTPTDAARAFGWKVSTYLGHENGDRNPSRAAAKRYARAYKVRWEWLLDGEGAPSDKSIQVPVIGEVATNGSVRCYESQQPATFVASPPGAGEKTVSLVVRGDLMRGFAEDGWLFFFDDERKAPSPELLGKLCVVLLDDKTLHVRTLQPGRKKGRYDLESPSASTMRDRKVSWAARVTWIKPID